MCGRYAATLPPEMMAELFSLLNRIDYPPRYNIVPTQPVVAIWEQQGKRTAQLVRWGFVPGWVKDPRDFPLLYNARSESMAEKPAFRDAVKNQRCVIPATGYYEWMKGPDGKKQPYYITRLDGQPMAFAGLYSTWEGPDGEVVDTAAVVTVDSSVDIASVYDRMPAVLEGEAVNDWLNTRDVAAKAATTLAKPLPQGTLTYHPVGKAIGSSKAEGPDLITPIDLTEAEVQPRKKVAAGGGGARQLDLF